MSRRRSRTPASRGPGRTRRRWGRSPTSSRFPPSTALPVKLGVSREELAQALATPEARERFTKSHGIDDEKLAKAIRAGLLRAVDDAEEAGALSPLLAGPLRETLQRIPLDQAIEIINNAQDFLGNAESFLGPAQDIIEQFLPGGL